MWSTVLLAGLITYFTRFSMIAFIKKDMLSEKTRIVLSYVPSAVFPAIIFPLVFLDANGTLEIVGNSKIIAAIAAILFGFFSRNVLLTIFSGLISYWTLIFLLKY